MRNPHDREGTVLVIILVVIVILTYACYRFVDRASVEDLAAQARSDMAQLTTCIDSGEELLMALLDLSPSEREVIGGIYDNSEILQGRIVYGNERSTFRNRFTILAPRIDEDRDEDRVSGLRFGLVNESNKLNLRALLDWDRRQPGSARWALLQLPGMDNQTADAILDWMDSDSTRREDGAEAPDYEPGMVGPANAIPNTLDELLAVRGVTREALFGIDQNANFHTSENELAEHQSRMDTALQDTLADDAWADGLPWSYYLTLHSAEKNSSHDGRPRIHLNDSNLQQLETELAARFSKEWAEFIVAYRQFGPADQSTGNPPVPETRSDPAESALVRIDTIYDLLGARVLIPGQGNRPPRILESPFLSNPTELRRYLLEFADQVTTDPRTAIPGRININQAPGRVLRGVPGLGEDLVEQILTNREDQTSVAANSRYHEAWLLAEGFVDISQMKQLAAYLTTRGAIYRGQIVGFSDGGPLAMREEIAIDATAAPPRIIFRRDLRRYGRGYSLDVLLGDRLSSVEGNITGNIP
ncbi:MAG: general secretion pathway protein GspK [Pirellulales bacterium]|nr:general secretion pathway protein GspK [Pirellulales bacterium]